MSAEKVDEEEVRRNTVSEDADAKAAAEAARKKRWAKNNAIDGRGITQDKQMENFKRAQVKR